MHSSSSKKKMIVSFKKARNSRQKIYNLYVKRYLFASFFSKYTEQNVEAFFVFGRRIIMYHSSI